MPYLPTAQSFLDQSVLLISARPTTTRISTKYTIPHPSPPPHPYKPSSTTRRKEDASVQSPAAPDDPPPSSKSRNLQPTLTLKTYDPVSGTCLKYRTDRAAEVGRLVACLETCGRVMAALPAVKEAREAIPSEDGVLEQDKVKSEGREDLPSSSRKSGQAQGKVGGGEAGGGKKKKKGKR